MKFIMNTFLIMFLLIHSEAVFAISDNKLIAKCTPTAKKEIHRLTKLRGCAVVDNKIMLTDIDNRMMSPSKYLYFEYQIKCEDRKDLQNGVFIAQYYMGKCYISND